ncbi:MAG4530 family protein [Mycoplasma buteonis]|uniref:MAG4530 family protein n=1 Tax=Mycoplasma buteonis TaxID=171280 RepID=UPI003CCC1D60
MLFSAKFIILISLLIIWLFSIYIITKSALILKFKNKNYNSLKGLRLYYLLNLEFKKFKNSQKNLWNLDKYDKKILKYLSKNKYVVYGSAAHEIFWNKNSRTIGDIDLFNLDKKSLPENLAKNFLDIDFNDGLFIFAKSGDTKIGISNTTWVPDKFITRKNGIYVVKPEVALLDKYGQFIKYLIFDISENKLLNIIGDINFILEQNDKEINKLINDKNMIEEIYITKLICNLFTTYFATQHQFVKWTEILTKENINKKLDLIQKQNNLHLNVNFKKILNYIIESQPIKETYNNTYRLLENKEKITEIYYEFNSKNYLNIHSLTQEFDSHESVDKLKNTIKIEKDVTILKEIFNTFEPTTSQVDLRYLILAAYLEVKND